MCVRAKCDLLSTLAGVKGAARSRAHKGGRAKLIIQFRCFCYFFSFQVSYLLIYIFIFYLNREFIWGISSEGLFLEFVFAVNFGCLFWFICPI